MLGYVWAGIYRSLLVGSIVTTLYRNEGHIRARDRIFGTGNIFRGGFLLRRGSTEFAELIRIVKLRCRVASFLASHEHRPPGMLNPDCRDDTTRDDNRTLFQFLLPQIEQLPIHGALEQYRFSGKGVGFSLPRHDELPTIVPTMSAPPTRLSQ